MGIGLDVIEFFIAVVIGDVSVSSPAETVVSRSSEVGDRDMWPVGVRIIEKRNKAWAVD